MDILEAEMDDISKEQVKISKLMMSLEQKKKIIIFLQLENADGYCEEEHQPVL